MNINKEEFYCNLENSYRLKCEEIGEKFETFNDALKKTFGIKHYAIQLEIIHTLNYRAKIGVYSIHDEAEAYLKVSQVFLEEGEAQLTKSKVRNNLMNYAFHMRELLDENEKNIEKIKGLERLAAIGATAGMVGHDIRNPLQTIVSDVYLLKDYLSNMPNMQMKNDVAESLDEIEQCVDYINKIVLDLQDYARPIKPVIKEVDVEPLIKAVLQYHKLPKNIETSYHIEDNAKVLFTDPDLLKRVLNNLEENAVQAMPDGGKVTITVSKNNEDTIIIIEDTGNGIPEEIKSKLFTPTFTTKSRGQGFGLAVCKRLTEAFGGTITFESEIGKGTKFMITLSTQH